MSGAESFVVVALGGIGEIGKNVYLYGLGTDRARKWLMVDLGVTFPDEREPGVDIVLPDIGFAAEERANLAGILLTHAHEDHFGAVLDWWPQLRVPVWATPFAAAMLKAKLQEASWGREVPVNVVAPGSRLTIGPFDVDLVPMAHSIPETQGVIFRTPLGNVLHTADWKLDPTPVIGLPTDAAKLAAAGDEGIAVMLCDSTNVLEEGDPVSEADVAKTLRQIVAGAKGRVVITTFASNVARLVGIARAGLANDRHVIPLGRAMHRAISCARETGLWPEDIILTSDEAFSQLPPETVCALATGSQGEPRAALARLAEGEHPTANLAAGDLVVFSARAIPGNEQGVTRVLNNLADRDIAVMQHTPLGPIHASGHPRRGELRALYGWVRPKCVIPMHGEPRHLAEHVRFARGLGIAAVNHVRNGDIVRLLPGPPEVIDEAPTGRHYRDGRLIVPETDGSVAERRKLAFVGTVAVAFAVSKDGAMAGKPQMSLTGVPRLAKNGTPMADIVEDAIFGAFDSIPRGRRRDLAMVTEAVRRSVRAAVTGEWGKKTVVIVQLIGV